MQVRGNRDLVINRFSVGQIHNSGLATTEIEGGSKRFFLVVLSDTTRVFPCFSTRDSVIVDFRQITKCCGKFTYKGAARLGSAVVREILTYSP